MVEVLVVVGLLGIGFLGIGILAVQGSQLLSVAADRHEAVLYLREGIEGVKALRNESWTDHIASASTDTNLYLVAQDGRWMLSASDPGPLYGRPQNFNRTVVVERVSRDSATDNIDPAGIDDPDTRRITVTLLWTTRGGTRTFVATTYLTNILDN